MDTASLKDSDLWLKVTVIIVLAALVLFIGIHGPSIWHWMLTVTGDQAAGSRWNLAWSGFLSAGVISGSIFTHTYHRMREANCHDKGCWRIGTHTTADGYKLCKKHIGWPKELLILHAIHEDHK